LPEVEENPSVVSMLAPIQKGPLRQQTLFQYVVPTSGPNHEQGLTKEESDFQHLPEHSKAWGDPLCPHPDKAGIFRVYSHNTNGLSSKDDHADVKNVAKAIKNKEVALLGLQETNRNFAKPAMLDSFHRTLSGVSNHYHGSVSSAALKLPSDYQPGGTAVSVRNKWATRFLDKGSDKFGRWSWLTLTGKGTTKVTFVSAYRVCDGAAEASLTAGTVRAQQEWMYASLGHSSVNLRAQVVTDIVALILGFQDKGHDIVLMMDANEASGPGSGVDKIMRNCNLVDAHSLSSDTTPYPATYQRGSTKIDFVLVSSRVVSAVSGVSILAIHDGYLSDHRALVVDLDANTLFGESTSSIVPPKGRRLTSTNPKALHLYIDHMRKHLIIHKLLDKVLALREKSDAGIWTEVETQQWETIDHLYVKGNGRQN
jgi:endonuclease/exonuclease/phosphatase family metal-dependent hydrolase